MHIGELTECLAWLIPLERKSRSWFSRQKLFAFIPAVAPLKPGTCAKNLGFLALKPSFLSSTKETFVTCSTRGTTTANVSPLQLQRSSLIW